MGVLEKGETVGHLEKVQACSNHFLWRLGVPCSPSRSTTHIPHTPLYPKKFTPSCSSSEQLQGLAARQAFFFRETSPWSVGLSWPGRKSAQRQEAATIQELCRDVKNRFFEKINKIDKPLARLIKEKKESAQINKIRNEKVEIMIDTTEIQRLIGDDYRQLHADKWKPRRNEQILRKVQHSKTEPGRN